MGKGYGYEWFSNVQLYNQEYLRNELGLEAGDDHIKLLMEGLFVQDKGSNTRNTVEGLLAKYGDEALPHIQQAVKEHNDVEQKGRALRPLSQMRSSGATELLKQYYAMADTRDLAAHALLYQPYRKEAKDEYLDMLRRKYDVSHVISACVEFGWKEALPYLEEICCKPDSWRLFYDAFMAKRALEGHPVPKDVIDAQDALVRLVWHSDANSAEITKDSRRTITYSQDKEAAAVVGLNLALFRTKASDRSIRLVNDIGWEILRALPTENTKPLVQLIVACFDRRGQQNVRMLQEERDMQRFKEFLNRMAGP